MKQLPKKKERHRSSHLELLGGVPSDALRRIRETAAKADLPLERVFRDVVAIGVSVVSDPQESPYQSLIAFRSGLASKQAEQEDAKQRESAPEVSSTLGEGIELGESVLAIPAEDSAGAESADQSGPDDVDERSGQWSEDEPAAEIFSER